MYVNMHNKLYDAHMNNLYVVKTGDRLSIRANVESIRLCHLPCVMPTKTFVIRGLCLGMTQV